MHYLEITGGNKLYGSINIDGAKNAALPLIVAALLSEEELTLENVPNLADIKTISKIIEGLGAKISIISTNDCSTYKISVPEITSTTAPYELVKTMRASVLVLGPLLARTGKAKVSLPGGCAIGARPVDLHINALEKMGAIIDIEDGYINASAPNGLHGSEIEFPFVSVGATENILMAASIANGTTVIRRAAREPEIVDLAKCLNSMGAKIVGYGSDVITIQGVKKLSKATHKTVGDRIEAASYACAIAAVGGKVTLTNIDKNILAKPLEILERAGVKIDCDKNSITICSDGDITGIDITTDPYPDFPTDLQAQFMAMFATAKGSSVITETIFENRFMHVPELMRLGAKIILDGNTAKIIGVSKLKSAEVMATDLRASMSLVIAALNAVGTTRINRIYHLDRGYSNLESKLNSVGAKIVRKNETPAS